MSDSKQKSSGAGSAYGEICLRRAVLAVAPLLCGLSPLLLLFAAACHEPKEPKETDSRAETGDTDDGSDSETDSEDSDTGDSPDVETEDSETGDTEDSETDDTEDSETGDTEDSPIKDTGIDISLSDADAIYIGEEDGAYLGSEVVGLGDANGDGFDDFALGLGPYIVYGPPVPGRQVPTDKGSTLHYVSWHLGAMEGNGDAYDDLLLGYDWFEPGFAYLIPGSASGVSLDITSPGVKTGVQEFLGTDDSYYSSFGSHIDGVGDIDGDGFEDMAVSNVLNSEIAVFGGSTYLFHGPFPGGTLTDEDADALFHGYLERGEAGWQFTGPGDLNGDGNNDLVIISVRSAFIVLGPRAGALVLSDADIQIWSGAEIPSSPAAAGDVDGDGTVDLALGSFTYHETGAAFVFTGSTLAKEPSFLEEADAILLGEEGDRRAGVSLSPVGDWNHDGHADLMIGSYGTTYIAVGPFEGTSDLALSAVRFIMEPLGDVAGRTVDHAGDVDGDGEIDLLIGDSDYCVHDDCHDKWSDGPEGAAYLILGTGL